MALVDDHEVEEVLGVVAEQGVDVAGDRHRLVAREVDLAARVDPALDPMDRVVAERRPEVLAHRLGQQHVEIGQEQNAKRPVRADGAVVGAQLRDDLHRGEGLPGAGGHEQQDPPAPRGDRLECTVHGDGLVPAGSDHVAVDVDALAVERLSDERGSVGVEPVPRLEGGPQLGRRGERVDVAFGACGQVVLDDAPPVGRVRDSDVELLGVAESLAHAVAGSEILPLRLHDGHRYAGDRLEDVVDAPVTEVLADPPGGEHALGPHPVLGVDLVGRPARGCQRR